jgi:hypothetical protein
MRRIFLDHASACIAAVAVFRKSQCCKSKLDSFSIMPWRARLAVVPLQQPENRDATVVQHVVVEVRTPGQERVNADHLK